MANILIFGVDGMLGHEVAEVFINAGHTVIGRTRSQVDINDKERVMSQAEFTLDFIINCAAYTKVDDAEVERHLCYDTNVVAVEHIVALAAATNATLMHFSTDYVFGGSKEFYVEDSVRSPINYYGETKALAEQYIEENLDKYYIIRTSWLFGKYGKNFVDTVSRICREKGMMRVVNDQRGCPTSASDLAQSVVAVLQEDYGIYHRTNNGSCSWYDFACEIIKRAEIEATISPCASDEFPQKAKRPSVSVLKNTKLATLPLWQEALAVYLHNQ